MTKEQKKSIKNVLSNYCKSEDFFQKVEMVFDENDGTYIIYGNECSIVSFKLMDNGIARWGKRYTTADDKLVDSINKALKNQL